MSHARWAREARLIATASTVAFVGLYAALHVLRPDIDPLRRHSSLYVLGPYGGLMTAAFMVIALGGFALAFTLRRTQPRSRHIMAGAFLVEGFAVMEILSGVFRTGVPGAPLAWTHVVHAVASMTGFVFICMAMVALGLWWRSHPHSRWHGLGSIGLGVLGLGLFASMFVVPEGGLIGLVQRALIGVLFLWVMVALRASALRRTTAASTQQVA